MPAEQSAAMATAISRDSLWPYLSLAVLLAVSTLGLSALIGAVLAMLFFLLGVSVVLLEHGWRRAKELLAEFDNAEARFPVGLPKLLRDGRRRTEPDRLYLYDRLTGCATLDPIVEQIVSYILRDFVDVWYSRLSTDEQLRDQLRHSAYRTVAALSDSLRQVDWTPLLTHGIVDDFASHMRLYRKARGKVNRDAPAAQTEDAQSKDSSWADDVDANLESAFFDLELDMEKTHCRDLVSTSPLYENAYLHDIADVLLYLLVPSDDFKCRPLRFMLREVFVKRIALPLLDQLSEPDYVNALVVWLLWDVPSSADDLLSLVSASGHMHELTAVKAAVDEHTAALRAKDTGGADDAMIKSTLASLHYVRRLVDLALRRCTTNGVDAADIAEESENSVLSDLPLSYILNNSISLCYFIDFLQNVGGGVFIDLFLAIEGFKVSAQHQLSRATLRRATSTQNAAMSRDELDNVREAALSLFNQYLGPGAPDPVPLSEPVVRKVHEKLHGDAPCDTWFDELQNLLVDTLERDVRFYPAFRGNPLYGRMLADMRPQCAPAAPPDPAAPAADAIAKGEQCFAFQTDGGLEVTLTEWGVHLDPGWLASLSPLSLWECPLAAHIASIGMGRDGWAAGSGQGAPAFALYHISAARLEQPGGRALGAWEVVRRYSDFHKLHAMVESKFPTLSDVGFPGKKTFNNLQPDFLEKRKRALNSYLQTLLHADVLAAHAGLDALMLDFVARKQFAGSPTSLSNLSRSGATRLVSSVISPLRSGVRAVGSAVAAAPDVLVDGVVKVGEGVGKNTGDLGVAGSPLEGRVGAALDPLNDSDPDSIPLRIMLLFMDEIFGLRERNQWFRRRLVAFLRQLVNAAMGSSINRKIIDFVTWLTSEEQVAEYLKSFRNAFWPGGVLAEASAPRPPHIQMRCRLVARVKLLAIIPDELRLFVGAETSRRGVELVFDALQNPHLNRRLLYVLLERLLITIFPDNKFDEILPKLHSKSPRCDPQGVWDCPLIIMRDALRHVAQQLALAIDALVSLSLKHLNTATCGRTHYQPASATTVGKRACLWIDALLVGFKGVQGVLQGLSYPLTGQTYNRLVDCEVLQSLSLVGAGAHKVCMDVRMLQAFGELTEPFAADQVGSSAMPYKRNPMRSERASGLARHLLGLPADSLLTAASAGFERTLDDSSNRRIVLPDAFLTADALLSTLVNILQGLVINTAKVHTNLQAELPFLALERVLMQLVKNGKGRQEAHAKIREVSLAASAKRENGEHVDLVLMLKQDQYFDEVLLMAQTLCDNPLELTGLCRQQVTSYIENEVKPLLQPHANFLEQQKNAKGKTDLEV